MKHTTLLLLLLSLLTISLPAADWVALQANAAPGAEPTIKVLSSDVSGTSLELTIPGFWVEKGPNGLHLRLPGGLISMAEGRPELPFLSCTLALPTLTEPTFSVRTSNYTLPRKLTVRMAPRPVLEGQTATPATPIAPLSQYPPAAAMPMHLGYWREVPLITLQLHPFKAKGDGTLLGIASNMVIDINHSNHPSAWPAMAIPRRLQSVLHGVCLNHKAIVAGASYSEALATEYLVIGPASLKPGVQPLLDWRAEQGYKIEYASITTTSATAIKNEIMTRYNGGKLEFVLLVGDYAQIPYYRWGSNDSDHWYSCLTGGASPDLHGDVGLGRLCGTSTSVIQHQAQKIINYETKPPAGNWCTQTILAAHKEQAPGKYVGCSMEIAAGALGKSSWTIHKQYGSDAATSNTKVSGFINSGVGIVNYRGHGGVTSWVNNWCTTGGAYDIAKVNALTNGAMTPIVFNIACLNGDFKSNCLQEAWMQTKGGAVASLGAIQPSYTTANHTYDKELYNAIFGQSLTNIYAFTYKATAAIIAMGSAGQSNAKMYWWGGDAATKVWSKSPDTLAVTHPATVKSSITSIAVMVKVGTTALQGADVCLYRDKVIQDVVTTDNQGVALFPISGLNAGLMKITVTAKDCKPYRGTINVTGQSYLGPTIPTGLAATEGAGNTALPAQYAPATTQCLYDSSLLTGVESGMIRTLFLRRDGTSNATFQAHKFNCDISLATTGVPGRAKWSTTSYQANRGTNFTKLLSGYTVDFGADPKPKAPPAPYTVMLPLQTPIQYTSGNHLLVQFDVTGTGTYTWLADAQPYFDFNLGKKYSKGCPAGRTLYGEAPYPNGQKKLTWHWHSGGGYSQPAMGILGRSNTGWGFFIIPLPLSWMGAPGCYLNTEFFLTFVGTTDPTGINGRFKTEVAMPNQPDLTGTTLYAQTLVLNPGFNQLGLMASEGLELTFATPQSALQLSTHSVATPFGDTPSYVDYKGLILKLGM